MCDDEPVAANDTDEVNEDDTSTDGNVITGVGTTSGNAGIDRVGADDATVTAVSFDGTDGVEDNGVLVIEGQYGTLEIAPDGTYTYELSAEGEAALKALGDGQSLDDEVFTYTLTDSDGSTSTATLTIELNGANDNPGLVVPDLGELLVECAHEDSLQGSAG